MKKILLLCAIGVLLVFTTCKFGFDERPDGNRAGIVPVERIDGITGRSQPYIVTPLSGIVVPEDATHKLVVWSIKSDGGTNSTLEGSRLTANAEGTVTVTARIANGAGQGVDYTQDFPIVIALVAPYAVSEIVGIPAALPVGEFSSTLNGVVIPNSASYKTIVWSVAADPENTGTVIDGNVLTAQRKGKVTIRATIKDGLLDKGDFTQDFDILISKGVIAAGYFSPTDGDLDPNYMGGVSACYWTNGELTYLPLNGTPLKSTASRIIYVGDKRYIAGFYRDLSPSYSTTLCYWVGVDDTVPPKQLPGGIGSNRNAINNIYSLVADGGYVYIFGSVDTVPYYWKIDADDDSAIPEKIEIKKADGNSFSNAYNNDYVYAGITVQNGRVYIAGRRGESYYWDSNNLNDGSIKATPLNVFVGSDKCMVTDITSMNGTVYLAGSVNSGSTTHPVYWRMEDSSPTVFPFASEMYIFITDQNGSLWFYEGSSGSGGLPNEAFKVVRYWDAAGNRTYFPSTTRSYILETMVFSDGDRYIIGFDSQNSGSKYGYMVLREPFPFRLVEFSGDNPSVNISGIAVR